MSLNNDDHPDMSSNEDEQPEMCGDKVPSELQNEVEEMSKSNDDSSTVIQEEQSEVSLNDEMSHEKNSDPTVNNDDHPSGERESTTSNVSIIVSDSSVDQEEKQPDEELPLSLVAHLVQAGSNDDASDRSDTVSICSLSSSQVGSGSASSNGEVQGGEETTYCHTTAVIANRWNMKTKEHKEHEKKAKKLFESAREIMTSEKSFVDVLNLICVDFKTFMESKIKKQNDSMLPVFGKDVFTTIEECKSIIFKSLPQMLAFNGDLLHDLEDRIANWDTLPKIADIFVKKGPFLRLHRTYIDDFDHMKSTYEKCFQNFPKFRKAVEEFESQPKCKYLKLSFHMYTPAKRVMQYKMMLENYMKHLPEDSIDFDDTTEALRIVSDVADHCDNSLFAGVGDFS